MMTYTYVEDGMVRFLEISEESEIMVDASMKAGILGCDIDTAFASLDLGLDRDDLLIAGGDMSDGGLYLFQARQSPEHVQCVPNWAPTIDFITAAVVPDENLVSKRSSSNIDMGLFGDRIFAGAGRGCKHGALVELRFGLQARMGTTIDLEEWNTPIMDSARSCRRGSILSAPIPHIARCFTCLRTHRLSVASMTNQQDSISIPQP
jgi:hypothetical protein